MVSKNPFSWFRQTVATVTQWNGSPSSGKQTFTTSGPSTNSTAVVSAEPRNDHVAGHISSLGGSSPTTQPHTINVVLFGECGVGKSSVVNLIARSDLAEVSSDVNGYTTRSTRYDISFDNMNFAVFDTVAFQGPEMGINGYLRAIEQTHELIVKLRAAGGIHFLLFCMRGAPLTATAQSNYRLFYERFCIKRVPIALVITGLENEVDMEDWWTRNKPHLELFGLESDGHACIIAAQDDTPGEDLKYTESQRRIRELLKSSALRNEALFPEPLSWFTELGGVMGFVQKHRRPKRKDIMKVLTHRCKSDPDTAWEIANAIKKGEGQSNTKVRAGAWPNQWSRNEPRQQNVDATPTIRRVIEETIRHMPRVLIDTTTGRLHDKTQQVLAFEKLPICDYLQFSMTIQLDRAHIQEEVEKFYRYVMFSHRWEYGEPLLHMVERISIYDLEPSPPNVKLQRFCARARSLGFRWAWSDTCCIDKKDNVVLQESLVAMFTWYRGSSLTIVYLRGIWSESQQPGDLRRSTWNTRAWPYQEYVAAEIIQFYTEDWKPYLGSTQFNHKTLPAIISEMQQVTAISAPESAVFCPGLDRVREKLSVASVRHTTLVEDIAYSLLGIFNTSIPVIYGEGNRAVGRLLEHVLTGSGDVTILAWTGRAGDYNSCLPVDLTVYTELVPLHVPQPIKKVEMDRMITTLRSSLPDPSLAVTLHKHFDRLPLPYLSANRLRLPGIVFRLTELAHVSGPDPASNLRVYHAMTSTFENVEIKTADNLTGMKNLCLVHPWIRPLLDQEFSGGAAEFDSTTQALRFVARLRQPFGALLFKPISRVEYRRVATDSLILVQIHKEVSLMELMDNTRTIEVQ